MRRILLMTRERRTTLARWMAVDAVCIFTAFFGALGLSSRSISSVWISVECWAIGFALAVATILGAWILRLYAVQARYLGMSDAVKLGLLCGLSTAVFAIGIPVYSRHIATDPLLPPSLYCILVSTGLGFVRVRHRSAEIYRARLSRDRGETEVRRLLLVGAGDAGELVIRELERGASSQHVVGIVDDDPRKHFTHLRGVPVLGTIEDIPAIVVKHRVEEVLIALPSAEGERMREIYQVCKRTGVRTRTLPGVSDLISGRAVVNQIREIDIADLLRRKPVQSDPFIGETYIKGKVVMITGGGGSIGGELARQVARMSPKKLVLVGKGENSIFEVEQQIRMDDLPAPVALIADVRDARSMESIFQQHRPAVVFHAAAHKHVPLMESNPIEAIRNNVGGTKNVVELAVRYEAEKFILVSTDKAVHPANVMGATKRVAERIVCAYAGKGSTDCAVVRFGNVLGSRGSLVPLLKAQIQRGGPVRVTHPEMTRYFMTIPEAVQLIVQAGASGRSGEIFILDMGEPVKVLDLAEAVIRLHGFEPNKTMPIVFTGPRPGEKLHEELTFDVEELRPTSHPKIRAVDSTSEAPWEVFRDCLDQLMDLCDQQDKEGARAYLMSLATERVLPVIEVDSGKNSERGKAAASVETSANLI